MVVGERVCFVTRGDVSNFVLLRVVQFFFWQFYFILVPCFYFLIIELIAHLFNQTEWNQKVLHAVYSQTKQNKCGALDTG